MDGRAEHDVQGEPRVDPEVWVEVHGDALFRFAILRLRDRDEAEDAVQECLLAALGAHQRFQGRSNERTWLIGILKNKIVDRIRARSAIDRTAASKVSSECFDHKGLWRLPPRKWNDDPSMAVQQVEFRRVLNNCLAKLPSGIGDALLLRELDRMGSGEICEVLSISSANLWQRLRRGRLLLRRCLEVNWFRLG